MFAIAVVTWKELATHGISVEVLQVLHLGGARAILEFVVLVSGSN